VTVKANDDDTAKKALAAIGRAGDHGTSNSKNLVIRARKAKDKKITDRKVPGLHLCCGACVNAVDKVVSSVDGATGHDAAKGAKVVTVKGKKKKKG
jgi:acetate kinase